MDPYLDTLVCMKIKLTYCFIKSKKYPHWYQCLQPLKKRQIPFYHLLQKASLEVGKFHFHSECEREREKIGTIISLIFLKTINCFLFQAISLSFPNNSFC